MYLSELKLWNFRQFGTKGENDFEKSFPGLSIRFQNGVNVLIGENNSGKTAVIDAIRYILHTKSGEYIAIDEKDFYKPQNANRTSTLKIECIFRGLTANDAGLFLECLSVEDDTTGNVLHILKLTLIAKRLEDGRIIVRTYSGNGGDSCVIPYESRHLLTAVYLKPLRDALQDMTHGYKSRLSQILQAHSVFEYRDRNEESGKHRLEGHYENLKKKIDEYFHNDEHLGSEITKNLNNIIRNHFSLINDCRDAVIQLTGSELPDILRQLDLILEDNKSGLGSLNILCIAAELLLFLEQTQGLKLTLIEELEAHIHPQLQLRLLDYFNQEEKFGQFILTTHSITLGATIPLEKLIIMKDGNAFPMDAESTMCTQQDYRFLHRFLDATKANLFFAKGLILVEGDAENILLPCIAKLINRDLHKYGVSIVNVGSTAYKRYVKIFRRKAGNPFGIKIAIISDLDVRSMEYYIDKHEDGKGIYHITDAIRSKLISDHNEDVNWNDLPSLFLSESEMGDFLNANKKRTRFQKGKKSAIINTLKEGLSPLTEEDIESIRENKRQNLENEFSDEIRIFLPKCWTLEYDLARSSIAKKLALAVEFAKAEKTNKDLTQEEIDSLKTNLYKKYDHVLSPSEAYEIFKPLNDNKVSKAITAHHLSDIIDSDDKISFEEDEFLKYIVSAIKYVTND